MSDRRFFKVPALLLVDTEVSVEARTQKEAELKVRASEFDLEKDCNLPQARVTCDSIGAARLECVRVEGELEPSQELTRFLARSLSEKTRAKATIAALGGEDGSTD